MSLQSIYYHPTLDRNYCLNNGLVPAVYVDTSPPLGYSEVTNGILKAMNMNTFQQVINEPSVTSIGQLFDATVGKLVNWWFGWKPNKTEVEATPLNFVNSSLIKRVSATSNSYRKARSSSHKTNKPLDKKISVKSTNDKVTTYYPDDWYSTDTYTAGIAPMSECLIWWQWPYNEVTYKMDWSIFYNESLTTMGERSQDSTQFVESVPKCLVLNGVDPYTLKVKDLHSYSTCATTPGLISQNLDRFTFNVQIQPPQGYYQDYVDSQKNISFSAEAAERCYTENLKQETNEYPTTVSYLNDGLECAVGEINFEYFNAYCARRYNLENYKIILPSGGPTNSDFTTNFCLCTVTQVVQPYLESEQSSVANLCAELNRTVQTLSFALGTDGSLIIQSQNGFLNNQMTPPSLDDGIQQCFNSASSQYNSQVNEQKKDKIERTILLISATLLPAATIATIASIVFCKRQKIMSTLSWLKGQVCGYTRITDSDDIEIIDLEA